MAISYLCGFEMNSVFEAQNTFGGTGMSIVAGRNSGNAGRALAASGSGPAFSFIGRLAGGTFVTLQSVRAYVKVGALPVGGACTLLEIGLSSASNPLRSVFLETDGSVTLRDNLTNSTAASAGSVLSADGNFHRVDFDCGYNAGVGWRVSVDGTVVASNASGTITAGERITAGPNTRLGSFSSVDLTFDDVVGYDSALPATLNDYNLSMLMPIADNSVGNWKRNDNLTTTNEFNAADNRPPTGTAVTAVLAANYDQNATAGSNVSNDNLDFGCQAYTNITGLTQASQVKAVQAICNDAQQVTTGSPKSGALAVYTNPVQASLQTFDFGLPQGGSGSTTAAAQGVYPAGWGTHVGIVTENPTVTVSSGPGVRIRRTGTYTRIVSVDFLAVYVMWEAAASPAAPPFSMTDRRVIRNSLLRR